MNLLRVLAFAFGLLFSVSAFAAPSVVSNVTPQSGDAVFIVTGQSNGGFYGNVANTGAPANCLLYNILDGLFYTCEDPLPSWVIPPGTGTGGSIWSWLGDLYAASATKPWSRVIIVPAAVYGSRSATWVPGQANFTNRAVGVHNTMTGLGWTPTAYLWMNGESDMIDMAAGTLAPGAHLTNVQAMVTGLRNLGITTPILGSRTATCRLEAGTGTLLGPDYDYATQAVRSARFSAEAQIRQEQSWLFSNLGSQQFYIGADTDNVGGGHRWDNCHLDSFGQYAAALMWLNRILLYKSVGLI